MNNNSKKMHSIELLRGIAAWAVVMHHYNQVFFDWDMSGSILGKEIGYFFQYYGKLGVDVFFVISGFIITLTANKKGEARDFIIKRLIRVIPAYWFYSLLLIPLSYILTIDNMYTDWNIKSLFLSLVFIPNENPSELLGIHPILPVGWTLNFEMFFYIAFGLLISLTKTNSAFALFFLLITSSIYWPNDWVYASILSSNYLLEFALGIAIAYIYNFIKEKPDVHYRWSTLLLIFSFTLFYIEGPQVYKLPAIAGLLLALIYLNSSFSPKLNKLSVYLGSRSYSVYLSHPMIIYILNEYGGSLLHEREILFLLLYITAILILSEFSTKYIENGKITHYLKKRFL